MSKKLLTKATLAQRLQLTDKFLTWLNSQKTPFDVRLTSSQHSFVLVTREIKLK